MLRGNRPVFDVVGPVLFTSVWDPRPGSAETPDRRREQPTLATSVRASYQCHTDDGHDDLYLGESPASRPDRSLIARLAAHESWANPADPSPRTAPARRVTLDRFERQVDPDGVLSPVERARRAGHARNAYFARLALWSAQARRKTPAVEDGNARASRLDEDGLQ